jgi:hypothetical protein
MKPPTSRSLGTPQGGSVYGPAEPDPCRGWVVAFGAKDD